MTNPFPTVYPETKGVPLEEMDAVFGEGTLWDAQCRYCDMLNIIADELQERMEDEESERASLVSRRSSRSRRSQRMPSASGRGLVSRLMGRNGRASYEPIGDSDE